MSISSPDDVDYIDTESPLIAPKMEEESSSIETVYTPSEKVKNSKNVKKWYQNISDCNKTKIGTVEVKSCI